MKQGLIDSRTQRFRQGNTDISLDEAVSQGLIDPHKVRPVILKQFILILTVTLHNFSS